MLDRTEIKVHLVGAGPGDPGLITLRGIECLQQADVVIYDRLVNPLLLLYAPDAEWIDVGKQPDHHPIPQNKINDLIVEKAQLEKRVVRLKGGDPFVFGRGGEEALSLSKAGISYEIVPGITSAIAAPAYAGIPITHRGVSQSVSFITGHSAREDNLPEEWSCLAGSSGTLVFLMGVHNLKEITHQLIAGGRHAETPIAIIEQGTCAHQRTITGTLANILEKSRQIQPPAIIIVGEVVKLREALRWYDRPATCPLLGLTIGIAQPFIYNQTGSDKNILPGSSSPANRLDLLSRKLSLLGALPVQMYTTRLKPTNKLDELHSFIQLLAESHSSNWNIDWILFDSRNAIDFFFDQVSSLGFDLRILSKSKIGAIGEEAALRLQELILMPDLILSGENELLTANQTAALNRQNIFYIRSERILESLGDISQETKVNEISIYETETQEMSASSLESLRIGNIEILIFSTPSSVYGLEQSLQNGLPAENIQATLSKTTVACINRSSAQAAQNIGLRVDIIPEKANTEAMIEAIIAWKNDRAVDN